MIKTIIFDIGNVLMRFDYMRYIQELLGDDESVYLVNGAIWRSGNWNDLDRGEDYEVVLSRMLQAEPAYASDIRRVMENIGQCMFKQDYAIPWIQDLKQRGYQVLYLSNYSRHIMEVKPEVLDFLPYTDGGVFSCDVHLVKPDPAIYQTICSKYSLTPGECVFLDDSADNVRAAQAFGLKAIHVSAYEQARAELEALLAEEEFNDD